MCRTFRDLLIRTARTFVLGSALLAPVGFTTPSAAAGLDEIARGWQLFMSECQLVLADPRTYLSSAQLQTQGRTVSHAVSPDGRALSIIIEYDLAEIEVFADTLSDREIRYCGYYLTIPNGWDVGTVAAQYVSWLRQNPTLEIVGGASSVDGYDNHRHTVLGLWPDYDLAVASNMHVNEFQLIVTRIVR